MNTFLNLPKVGRPEDQDSKGGIGNDSALVTSPDSTVAVLFAREDSIYKTLQNVDVWDKRRDATQWHGGCAIVAHPPCPDWSRMRSFSNEDPARKALALWTIDMVRKHGGVFEHPASSSLWPCAKLPMPAEIDSHGGFTLAMPQFWFGHKANKASWFYVCGVPIDKLPPIPFNLGYPTHVISKSSGKVQLPEVTKAEREHTPLALAQWLVALARLVPVPWSEVCEQCRMESCQGCEIGWATPCTARRVQVQCYPAQAWSF